MMRKQARGGRSGRRRTNNAEMTYAMAHAAGWDAGNASMRAAGRTAWSDEDWDVSAATMNRLLGEDGEVSR